MRKRRVAVLLATLAPVSCEAVLLGVDFDDLPLVTVLQEGDALSPEPVDGQPRLRIRFTFTNHTDETLHLWMGCGSISVDRRSASEWAYAWGQSCQLELWPATPIRLAPGESYSDEVRPRAATGWSTGEYRLRLNKLSSEILSNGAFGGEPIPLALRVSAPFRVAIPEI